MEGTPSPTVRCMARRLALETILVLATAVGTAVAAVLIAATQSAPVVIAGAVLALAVLWHLERTRHGIVARAAWLRLAAGGRHESDR
ncbi:hypothetical protein [Rhodanobacter denitrificans]|uniref:Uncharacterized protein n=1 Tax=Rhodanobacter denitrificans TaxID=666685 RepID=M4NE91_9GAMM|nr:hypothetical protein [Rhodanobacter denitrificans]AGG89054.1 hypothetical protein R2APBS1_1931 [Rhodanobacter denitrificans]UJJ53081.1 hypothetical protein LRK52_18420 [Rhodanobacter denitrificans]